MPQGVGNIRCEACRRSFGGQFGFDRHRVDGICLPAKELRKRGYLCRPEGTWVRIHAGRIRAWRQMRLFRQGRPRKPRGGSSRTRARQSPGTGAQREGRTFPRPSQDTLPGIETRAA